jgi:hypothetical protein
MSTEINQLPNINKNIPNDDDDDAIQEVLAEIHNEQNPQINNEPPPVPIESMQQMPPQPNNNQFELQQEMINNLQMELQNQKNNNNNNNKFIEESLKNDDSDTTSRFKLVFENLQNNIKLYLVIFISFIILQNESISNLIINKLPNINIPYFNLLILGIIQVIIIIISQRLL